MSFVLGTESAGVLIFLYEKRAGVLSKYVSDVLFELAAMRNFYGST